MATILLVLLCDAGRPVPRYEVLGNHWTPLENVTDRGLRAQRFYNHDRKRNEVWYQAESGEWFLQAKDGLYVLASRMEGGPWVTRPSVRLVFRDGAWVRVSRTADR